MNTTSSSGSGTNLNLIDRLTEPYRASLDHLYEHHLLQRLFSGNAPLAEFTINTALTIGFYWALSALYLLVDLHHWPLAALFRYKIQAPHPKSRPQRLSPAVLSRLVRQVLSNQLLTTALSSGILLGKALLQRDPRALGRYYHHYLYHYLHHRHFDATFPPLSRLALQWAGLVFIRELLFYYSHAAFHHFPLLYRSVHKRHHEWTAPIALATIYCHPVEHLLSNMLPMIAGPLLLGAHPLVTFAWEAYVAMISMHHHCGYHFPFMPNTSPLFHDFHHRHCTGNFGIFGFFDWLHGTDKLYRQSRYWPDDRPYFSLTPLPVLEGDGGGGGKMDKKENER